VTPLTRAIPERIRGGLRRCAIQVDIYFTLLTLLPCGDSHPTLHPKTSLLDLPIFAVVHLGVRVRG